MSDADDQMGGAPDQPPVPGEPEKKKRPDPDEESEQSFPASDPPANY